MSIQKETNSENHLVNARFELFKITRYKILAIFRLYSKVIVKKVKYLHAIQQGLIQVRYNDAS